MMECRFERCAGGRRSDVERTGDGIIRKGPALAISVCSSFIHVERLDELLCGNSRLTTQLRRECYLDLDGNGMC